MVLGASLDWSISQIGRVTRTGVHANKAKIPLFFVPLGMIH